MNRRSAALWLAFLAGGFTSACAEAPGEIVGAEAPDPSEETESPSDPALPPFDGIATVEAEPALPFGRFEDWVTYGDAYAIFRVDTIQDIGGDTQGESLFRDREVTATVERVLWTRPGAPSVPSTISFSTSGTLLREGRLVPYRIDGALRLEEGHTYVAPLALFADNVWRGLFPATVAQVVDGRIVRPSEDSDRRMPPSLEGSFGRTPDEVAAVLARTEPNSSADGYWDRDPVARYEAVVALESEQQANQDHAGDEG